MVGKEALVRQLGESISQGKGAQRQVEHNALKDEPGVLALAAQILQLGQFREDERVPCARTIHKFMKCPIFYKKKKTK